MSVGQTIEFNHPELKWRTTETEHFFIHFHQEEERTASIVGKIAEEIYLPVTALYRYVPDGKIHFIVRDHEDNSNGAAFYYDNKVEIWASSMDFVLRGSHNWLRNVVTHEFVHMISLGAARKMPRQIPAVYLQWIGYEKETRTDVIHGYPNTLVSFPIAGTVVPMWFAEGMTQTQIPGWNYDTWDSHRDMLLRTASLQGRLLTLNEMGVFGKNSIENERVYNQGYALVLYIVHRYGRESLSELVRALKPPYRYDFNGAVKKALGMSQDELYREWSEWITRSFKAGIEAVNPLLTEGKVIEPLGTGNFYPIRSPDGKKLAYISNRKRDYLSQTSLWIRDSDSPDKIRQIADIAEGSFSWSPDGHQIVYAKKKPNANGSRVFDLYVYDLDRKKETRLSKSARLRDPDWSVDGKAIVCVTEKDGTSNLELVHPINKSIRTITSFRNGEQIFQPKWFGKNGKIIFAFSESGEGRDIAEVDSSGAGFRYLIRTDSDERDPRPNSDGRFILYASDQTGIFNIYRYDVLADSSRQITNAIGGAFMPSLDSNGRLLFALFRTDGYHIAEMDSITFSDPVAFFYRSPYDSIRQNMERFSSELSAFDDQDVQVPVSKPYKPIFSKLAFYPRIMMDYPRKLKIGAYFTGSDFLDQFSLLGGAAVNGVWDSDIFGILEYKKYRPTLFVELYQQRRHTSVQELSQDIELLYTLMGVDLGFDWKLDETNSLRTTFQYSRYQYSGTLLDTYQNYFGKFSSTYHKGKVLQLIWNHRSVSPSVISEIAPLRGRVVSIEIDRAWQSFYDSTKISAKYGLPIDYYKLYGYEQFQLDWKEYCPLPVRNHSLMLHLKGGWIDRPVDDFYHFFAGGLDGLKGYPYYSLDGQQLLQAGLTYRFPLARKMGVHFLWFNFDNLFLSVYGQAGNAWTGKKVTTDDWMRVAGAQMRLGLFSFYSFPMALTFDAAYGLDRFTKNNVTYGREWRYYFGLLFDFLD